jgi:predicted DNA-binding transcriptional regulator AlpA
MPAETCVKLAQIIGEAGTPGLFPVSRSAWYSLIRQGRMPSPLKPFPGSRASFWRLGDVLEAIQQLETEAAGAQYETPLARKRRAAAAEGV